MPKTPPPRRPAATKPTAKARRIHLLKEAGLTFAPRNIQQAFWTMRGRRRPSRTVSLDGVALEVVGTLVAGGGELEPAVQGALLKPLGAEAAAAVRVQSLTRGHLILAADSAVIFRLRRIRDDRLMSLVRDAAPEVVVRRISIRLDDGSSPPAQSRV